MADPVLVRGLQERAARALPAASVTVEHGWWLRHAPGCSWWVATVLPHGVGGREELLPQIARAEEFYAGYGATARFQITPGACPAALDDVLSERGYGHHGPMALQVADTAQVRSAAQPGSLRVVCEDRPTRAWFDGWLATHPQRRNAAAEWDLLSRVPDPAAYARAVSGDDVVAVGRAAADTGWAGVFGMGTLPAARGKGAARGVLVALAGWAGAHHADRLYLQVEQDNVAALRLYQGMGFRQLCEYHYRWLD